MKTAADWRGEEEEENERVFIFLCRFDAQIKSHCFHLTGVELEKKKNVDRRFIHSHMKGLAFSK